MATQIDKRYQLTPEELAMGAGSPQTKAYQARTSAYYTNPPANTGGAVGEVPEMDLNGQYYYRSSGQGNFGPTIGSVYGNTGNSEYDKALRSQLDLAKSASEQPDPNDPAVQAKIRADALAAFQAEIDATNAIYADKLETAAREGRGRLGTTTAMSARAGLLGSDFGQAQYSTVEEGNRQIAGEIQNEKALKISNIMSKAREQATKDIADKVAARKAGLDDYIKYLGEAQTRKATNAKTAAKVLLAQGATIKELDENTLNSVLSSYGITKDELDKAYNEELPAYEAAQEEKKAKEADLKYKEAQIAELQGKTLTPEQLKAKLEGDLKAQLAEISLKKSQEAENWASAGKINAELGDKKVGQNSEYLGTLANNGREAVKGLLAIGSSNPEIFGRTASAPVPDWLRSDAYRNYKAQLDFLKGNIIPAALTAMREASKTGGALGQVSDREGAWLASSLGALEMNQAPSVVLKQLTLIDESMKRWQDAVEANASETKKDSPLVGVGEVVNDATGLPDGTTVIGEDGRSYIVQGGKFVAQ